MATGVTALSQARRVWEGCVRECREQRLFAALLVLVADTVLTLGIVAKAKYTEIDWVAYMQEVGGVEGGEYDYSKLSGQTGPLVYPAGFVWIFMAFKWMTDDGKNIYKAQLIFAGVYVCTQALVLAIYMRCKQVPAWAFILLLFSKRAHSVYVLRLFNDGVAMLFVYAAIYLFTRGRWAPGCVLYSLGVSVKMNALLFAPALLYLLICARGVKGAIAHINLCALIQLVLAAPFLVTDPIAYIAGSFNLGRVFMRKWSVNLKFLPEEIFVSKLLAVGLLAGHLAFLAAFYFRHLKPTASELARRKLRGVTPAFVCKVLLVANFVGVAFARTIHYQFYAWYFHAIPGLLWATDLNVGTKLGIFAMIESAYNATNPFGCHSKPPGPECGTPLEGGALLLSLAHFGLLLALLLTPQWDPFVDLAAGEDGGKKEDGGEGGGGKKDR